MLNATYRLPSLSTAMGVKTLPTVAPGGAVKARVEVKFSFEGGPLAGNTGRLHGAAHDATYKSTQSAEVKVVYTELFGDGPPKYPGYATMFEWKPVSGVLAKIA
jgi:hypothetical protein